MKPEDIYNGLEYTTKEINRTFKIKVNGLFNGKKKYFENSDNDRIYSDIEPDGYVTDYGNKYPLLRINDVANSDAMLEFAVMGQMYDVLNLSYVGRMKG